MEQAARNELRHCVRCGGSLTTKTIDGRSRLVCGDCGWVHYEQLKVGAAALVEQDGRLLLVCRALEPFKDTWSLPSGYCEADEDPAETAVRELNEETGLRADVQGIAQVFYFDDDPRGNGILLLYRCVSPRGSIKLDVENSAAQWFGRGEIPDEIAGGGHDLAVAWWARLT